MGPNFSLPDDCEVVQIPAHLATDEGHILACIIAVHDMQTLLHFRDAHLVDDGYYGALFN
jgi:hypothetical protein